MSATTKKSAFADKFVLRFDAPGLREALKVRAAENRRSLNSELLALIETGLKRDDQARQSSACA